MTVDWYTRTGNNEQSSGLFLNAMADPEALSPEQWFQFVMHTHGLMLAYQNSFYLVGEGTLDPEVQRSMTEAMLAVKAQPGFVRYWEQRRDIFFPEFRLYVDSIFASDREHSEGVYRPVGPE